MITDQGCGFSLVVHKVALKTISKKNYRNVLGHHSIVKTNVYNFPGLLKRIHLFAYVNSDPGGTFTHHRTPKACGNTAG